MLRKVRQSAQQSCVTYLSRKLRPPDVDMEEMHTTAASLRSSSICCLYDIDPPMHPISKSAIKVKLQHSLQDSLGFTQLVWRCINPLNRNQEAEEQYCLVTYYLSASYFYSGLPQLCTGLGKATLFCRLGCSLAFFGSLFPLHEACTHSLQLGLTATPLAMSLCNCLTPLQYTNTVGQADAPITACSERHLHGCLCSS